MTKQSVRRNTGGKAIPSAESISSYTSDSSASVVPIQIDDSSDEDARTPIPKVDAANPLEGMLASQKKTFKEAKAAKPRLTLKVNKKRFKTSYPKSQKKAFMQAKKPISRLTAKVNLPDCDWTFDNKLRRRRLTFNQEKDDALSMKQKLMNIVYKGYHGTEAEQDVIAHFHPTTQRYRKFIKEVTRGDSLLLTNNFNNK